MTHNNTPTQTPPMVTKRMDWLSNASPLRRRMPFSSGHTNDERSISGQTFPGVVALRSRDIKPTTLWRFPACCTTPFGRVEFLRSSSTHRRLRCFRALSGGVGHLGAAWGWQQNQTKASLRAQIVLLGMGKTIIILTNAAFMRSKGEVCFM